jgi:hypothetical protein
MNKILLLTILSFVFQSITFGQDNHYEFIGVLNAESNGFITYKLIFEELKNGKIEGESISDFYGKDCTISKIEGSIDKKKNLISFKETSNLSTKSKANTNLFCFVHADNLKIKTTHGKSIIQGSFNGYFPSGKSCVNGSVYLVSAEILETISEKINKIDTTNLEDSTKLDLKKLKTIVDENKTLTANQHLKFKPNADELKLEIWDSYREDGDQVDIYINEQKINQNIEIKQERKVISIPISADTKYIKIVAVNEGSTPPNTVNFQLKDGTNYTSANTRLKKGEVIYIDVTKKK